MTSDTHKKPRTIPLTLNTREEVSALLPPVNDRAYFVIPQWLPLAGLTKGQKLWVQEPWSYVTILSAGGGQKWDRNPVVALRYQHQDPLNGVEVIHSVDFEGHTMERAMSRLSVTVESVERTTLDNCASHRHPRPIPGGIFGLDDVSLYRWYVRRWPMKPGMAVDDRIIIAHCTVECREPLDATRANKCGSSRSI